MTNSSGRYKKDAYKQAVVFRKRGFTYTEIAKICDVSRGTVSNWFAKEEFSQVVAKNNKKKAYKENAERIKLVNKARNVERNTQYKEILRLAETEYKHYSKSPKFIAGLMLYRGFGDMKHSNLLRVTTSDLEVHRIFISFAKEYLGISPKDIRFWVLLYPEHDEVKCMKIWSKNTGLSVSQFYKNQIVPNHSNSQTLHFGVGNTIIGSTLLKKKVVRWIEIAIKEL